MPLERRKWITRADLRANPTILFVFGDNLERRGYGGQAKEMRGELNAIGLPTKRSPYEYLSNNDLDEVDHATVEARDKLITQISEGRTVIWPQDGIGTGLARLRECAPTIADFYDRLLLALEA